MALAGAGNVNLVALGEHVSPDLIAHLVGGDVVQAKFAQITSGGNARFCKVAELGFVLQFLSALLRELSETDLNRLIAVGFHRLDLRDSAGAGFDDRDRHQTTIAQEDLGHADLFAENCLLHCYTSELVYSLISISTPAGRSSLVRASIVLGVG